MATIRGLTQAPEVAAFRAADAVLRADPGLRRVGVAIHSWTGDDADDDPPSVAAMPWVRITPSAGPAGWENQGQHKSDLSVNVELAVAGLDADDLLNLWHAVRAALWPQAQAAAAGVEGALSAAGIVAGELTQQPFPTPSALDEGGKSVCLLGLGIVKLVIFVNT